MLKLYIVKCLFNDKNNPNIPTTLNKKWVLHGHLYWKWHRS